MVARKAGTGEAQRRIQSIEVGFRVIRVLEDANGPMPLRDIAAAAGMPPSKAHLYLVSFIQEGVAFQDSETGHYGLGTFAIQLGLSAIRQLDVVGLAREHLVKLSDSTGYAAYLSLWGDRGPGIVSKVDGIYQGSLAVRLGYVLPLLSSATGQIFHAFLNEGSTKALCESELQELAAQPGETRNVEALRAEVAAERDTIRANGYAMSTNKVNWNFSAIAAPVYDYSYGIVAAVTVLGAQNSLRKAGLKNVVEQVLQTSRSLSTSLGAAPSSSRFQG
ncbi:IclR family transcriptional regulator [Sagittula stellata]|uniref:Regulatory proteins, IclR n=1 Tax=Sagittula stellata (strain ATCC 700073 / DSM 11524 / E-37) TaxID=388399 RepID=A3K499_SAGS3|nr:IclR family transcriptional regulator [Sagittula stellata]EBA07798.1 regulatory proteins, IclR [Sagittula stellata E-37]